MIQTLLALFDRRPRSAEDWLVRMGRPRVGARDQSAFLAWLEEDEDHLRQYQAARADRAALEGLRGAFEPDLARLRRGRSPHGQRAGAPRRVLAAGGLVAAGAAIVALVGVPLLTSAPEPRLFRSEPGRITDIILADGSRVTLDAGSAIEVALSDEARRVTLVEGAAFFDVAHDADRPFQVGVADRRVIVAGTRFETALRPDGAAVSLLEGRVAIGRRDVSRRGALDGAVRLQPGNRARFQPGKPGERLDRIDVEAWTAWRQRRLVFRDAPLSEVLKAASRYTNQTLVLDDPRLAQTRVTTVLPLEGEGDLIGRMDRLLPITVEPLPQGGVQVRVE